LRRALQRVLRHPRQPLAAGHDLAVCRGLLEQVLLEAAAQFGELEAEILERLLVAGSQLRAGAPEVAERPVQVPAPQSPE